MEEVTPISAYFRQFIAPNLMAALSPPVLQPGGNVQAPGTERKPRRAMPSDSLAAADVTEPAPATALSTAVTALGGVKARLRASKGCSILHSRVCCF
jgi:hypothetical protein